MQLKYRRSPIRALASLLAAVVVALSFIASASAADSAADAALKGVMQKRLLVPDPKNMSLGPSTPGPFPGVSSRTVTITNPAAPGQKAEIELFTDASGKTILIAQHYAVVDQSHPWE